MPSFTYTARDESGSTVTGTIAAPSQVEAARAVRREGKFVVRMASTRPGAVSSLAPSGTATTTSTSRIVPRGGKFRPDDLIYFTNQLAVMLETGVALAEALEACVNDSNSPAFARALDAVIESVIGGTEFSAALAQHPRIFPVVYVNLIKASEATGGMAPMLLRLANFLEHQREIARKIKGAVAYPIFMLIFAIGVTIFLMTFVLPRFASIYAGREAKLPVLTRYLINFSTMLSKYGVYGLAVLLPAAIALFFYFRTAAGRLLIERVRFALPLIGPLSRKSGLARSLRTLGTMLQAGVAMLEGISLTAGVTGSHRFHALWTLIHDRVEAGQQLSDALADRAEFPRPINKMLSAGERAGRLGVVMERAANFCEMELNASIKTLTSMIEPAIVMFLGVVVGGLVLALLLPIFTISRAMR